MGEHPVDQILPAIKQDKINNPKTDYAALMREKPNWERRYWPKVEKSPKGCWIWTAAKNNKGYGVFAVYALEGRSKKFEYAHRVSYICANGPVPTGHVVDHKCCTPSCVNPDHLQAITISENCAQGSKRASDARGMICKVCGSEKYYSHMPSGTRKVCGKCSNLKSQMFKKKKRAERAAMRGMV